jgi:hypothetical protein
MSAQESTWDTAIADAGTPPPSGEIQETPSETVEAQPAPAEETTQTQETAAVETTSDEAARTVETPEAETAPEVQAKEEVNPEDPPEVNALPPSARKWARNRDREARVVDDFLDPEKPVLKTAERLYEKSASRYSELATTIYDTHRDFFLERDFGLTYEELKARATAEPQPRGDAQIPGEGYDPLEDDSQPDSVKAEIRESRALKEKYGTLESKVTSIEQQEQQRADEARQAQVEKIGQELYESVLTVIPEGIKEFGLEVSERDPPIVKGLKLAAQHILKTEVVPAFDRDPDNVKAVKRAQDFARRLERDNAFREEDALKVRTRNALTSVREREEVKAIFDALKLYADSQAAKIGARGSTAPQVPAANGGGTMPLSQPAATWDQLTG